MWNKGVAATGLASRTTRSGCSNCAMHIILGVVSTLAGCSAESTRMQNEFSLRPQQQLDASTAQPREVRTSDIALQRDAEIRNLASPDQGNAVAGPVADPGAIVLVQRLATVFDAESDHRIALTISTWHLRNQSRAQSAEFDAMTQRLAMLLDAAGREHELHFTSDAARPVDYHLTGTAYLVNAGGFDQWELYLALKPADRSWTLWQSDSPVRLLRATRLRSQQIFLFSSDKQR